MPFISSGPVRLYYEEAGSGHPMVFVHEFSGDGRSWEPQVRHFSRRYRCTTFNARGYPPSDVPEDLAAYSQEQAVGDVLSVLDERDCDEAILAGLSMGGFTALHVALQHPDRVRALIIGGVGYGSTPDGDDDWRDDVEALASRYNSDPEATAASHAEAPGRIPFRDKDPRGWAEFHAQLAEHPGLGAANTLRGVQRDRPNLYDLKDELARLHVPTLITTGDEDEPCLDTSVFLKRTIPTAALSIFPKSGHTVNLEEPAKFNSTVDDFLHTVEVGRWSQRDRDAAQGSKFGDNVPMKRTD